jgi:DMSO/TMAO reductase YedYZ molybdopterin-dependent catalytic subunit
MTSNDGKLTRRGLMTRVLAGAAALVLGGCDKLSETTWFPKVLGLGEKATYRTQRLILRRKAMAQEFPDADLSPFFRSNGTAMPDNPDYRALAAGGFKDYRLEVSGLVERPMTLSLNDIRKLPSRTQITRHDCVEGWSAIGKWKGARLSAVLETAKLKPNARYAVFHCADPMEEDGHPQTILAYELNDQPLPIKNGAPLRLRLERQLGYKMAKYVMRIEIVEDFSRIAGGKGGYWEDQGYEWYAGI